MICCKVRKGDAILLSAAVVVNAHNRAMQYVVCWGGRCKRLVDGSELGVAVPKIRELSKGTNGGLCAARQVLAEGLAELGSGRRAWVCQTRPSFATNPIFYQFPEFLACLIHLSIIFPFNCIITKPHIYKVLW